MEPQEERLATAREFVRAMSDEDLLAFKRVLKALSQNEDSLRIKTFSS